MKKAILVGIVLAFGVAQANAAVILDGNFAGAPDPFQDYSTGQTIGATGAWTVASGTVDWIGNYWAAPSAGGGSVDLDGTTPGSISQTLSGLLAGTYTISFALAGNPDGPPPSKGLAVDVTGSLSQDYTFLTTGSTHTDMNYSTETYTFTTLGGNQVLTFASLDTTPGFYGPVIGDVSISAAVPEPSTWAMLVLGFMGVGFLAYRKKTAPRFRMV